MTYADVAFALLRKWVGDDEVPAADLQRIVAASYRTCPAPTAASSAGGKGSEASTAAAAAAAPVWDSTAVAPLVPLTLLGQQQPQQQHHAAAATGERVWLLEQFHGPTCAFKDLALQFLGE